MSRRTPPITRRPTTLLKMTSLVSAVGCIGLLWRSAHLPPPAPATRKQRAYAGREAARISKVTQLPQDAPARRRPPRLSKHGAEPQRRQSPAAPQAGD